MHRWKGPTNLDVELGTWNDRQSLTMTESRRCGVRRVERNFLPNMRVMSDSTLDLSMSAQLVNNARFKVKGMYDAPCE